MANRPLDITDYMDPGCPFCTDAFQNEPPIRSIPIDRIRERLDADYARNDTESAERHLDYWLREAEEGRDLRGELFLRNERMGFFRKAGRKEEAFENAEDVLNLMLWNREEKNIPVPRPSSIGEIKVPENATIALFKADTLEYRKLHDTKSVRKNVTIPSWLNTLAISKNINFSNLLQNALMNELGIDNK